MTDKQKNILSSAGLVALVIVLIGAIIAIAFFYNSNDRKEKAFYGEIKRIACEELGIEQGKDIELSSCQYMENKMFFFFLRTDKKTYWLGVERDGWKVLRVRVLGGIDYDLE